MDNIIKGVFYETVFECGTSIDSVCDFDWVEQKALDVKKVDEGAVEGSKVVGYNLYIPTYEQVGFSCTVNGQILEEVIYEEMKEIIQEAREYEEELRILLSDKEQDY